MSNSLTLEQLISLNDEIASIVRARVPLEMGLNELGGESAGGLHDFSQALAARLSAGASLPQALAAEERRVPAIYRAVVEAGLRAGRLPAALEAVSNYARELVDLRRKITLALLYPFIVVAFAYLLFVMFMVDMIERFHETYTMFQIQVGWPLAIAVGLADAASRWWWVPVALFTVALAWWIATGGVHILSFSGPARPLAWIPGVAAISRAFQFANFADLLALLVEHQVPLHEGLRLSADATGGGRLQRSARQLAEAIERGSIVPGARFERKGFPPFLHWVLTSGQNGGGLARMLRHAGQIYRRRAGHLSIWFKLVFPIVTGLVIGGGVTVVYAATLFGPLVAFWRDLGIE
jgi:general secretion pathway protein F